MGTVTGTGKGTGTGGLEGVGGRCVGEVSGVSFKIVESCSHGQHSQNISFQMVHLDFICRSYSLKIIKRK